MTKLNSPIFLCLIPKTSTWETKEFQIHEGQKIFVIKVGERFYGYVNNCPHNNWPLNFLPNLFLTTDKSHIQCSNHMALFEKETGECIHGPCVGASLEPVDIYIENDHLYATL